MVRSPQGHRTSQAEDLVILTTCVQAQRTARPQHGMWDLSWLLKRAGLRQTEQQWERMKHKRSANSWTASQLSETHLRKLTGRRRQDDCMSRVPWMGSWSSRAPGVKQGRLGT